MTQQQRQILDGMFYEVRNKFYEVLHGFYENEGINLHEVNINNDDYMNDLCDTALQNYSNSNDYIENFEDMDLWDNTAINGDPTTKFGIAISYITRHLKIRLGETYHIPIEYFTEYNFNGLRVLFQYVYLSENMDVVNELLIDIYNDAMWRLEEDETILIEQDDDENNIF